MSCKASLYVITVTSTCTSKECAYETKLYGSATVAATCEQAGQVHLEPLEIVGPRADDLRLLEDHTFDLHGVN